MIGKHGVIDIDVPPAAGVGIDNFEPRFFPAQFADIPKRRIESLVLFAVFIAYLLQGKV